MQSRAFLVTGAGSGIGRAIALKIIAQGHVVFGVGRSPEKLAATADLAGDKALFQFEACDLSKPEGVRLAVRAFESRDLALHGLVNNAGIFERRGFDDSEDDLWEDQFQTNLMSAVRLTRALASPLRRAAPSSVLNVSSTLGLRPVAQTSAYSAIKAAMINWTQSLALEWAPHKVRVNCICPGLVKTPIHGFFESAPESDEMRAVDALQPLGRIGTPEDIARAAWFLLSEDSDWTTGATLKVDGGINL